MRGISAILLMIALASTIGAADVRNGPTHDGVSVTVDLPPELRRKNAEGIDHKGLCVFASLDMAGHWGSVRELEGLWSYMLKQPGGGWPEKVDQVLKTVAPGLDYVQYEGDDPALIEAAIATGRPACTTLGFSDFYRSRGVATIYHMVLLVHLDAKYACVIDNNDPDVYTWMDRETFLKAWKHPGGKGWAIVLLAPPPPPPPRN